VPVAEDEVSPARAASRAACTAGNNSAIKMPMIVMTTSSSTRETLLIGDGAWGG